MADNVIASPGSGGATFATDDIGSVHYPIGKQAWGPLDTVNLVDDASGKRVPVKVGDALPAGDSNIGNVDIVTVPAPLSTAGGGTEATALRVTIATDSTGVVSIDDNGGSLTVDGTVDTELPAAAALADNTANPTVPGVGAYLMGFDGTTWDRIQTGGAATGALKVDGSAVTQPVSVAGTVTVGAHAVTNAGTFAVQESGAALTALQLIDDAVATTASAIPAKGVAVSGTDGTNARVLKTDTAGELQVDVLTMPTTAVSQSGTWTVQVGNTPNTAPILASIHDGTTLATVRNLAANDALNVAIVDGSGGQITSFGGGVEYTEDAVAATDPVGKATILVRQDTPTALVNLNLDNVAQRGTNFGAAYCQIVSSAGALIDTFGGSGGTAQADRSAFTDGTTTATPIAGVLNDTPIDPTEDQAAAVRITAKRALHVNIRDDAGDSCMDGANNAMRVNIVAGAGSGGTAQADESAFTEGTTSMTPIGGVLNDTITTDPTEDQAAAVRITAKRAFHTNLRKVDGTEIASGGGVEANALRVTIATDSTGVVSIDDNAGSLTVDGTVSITGAVDTELPAAAALADNTANPTVPLVGSCLMGFDGTNWDRLQTGAATGGALKVDGSAVTQPISVAGTVNVAIASGGIPGRAEDSAHTSAHEGIFVLGVRNDNAATTFTDATGDYSPIATDSAGRVGVADLGGSITVDMPNTTVSGSLTAAATSVTLSAPGASGSATIQIIGTWVATVQFEATTDGTNFYAVNAQPVVGGAFVTSSTTNGQWLIGTAGAAQVRVRCSAFTSGTIVITLVCSSASTQVVSLGNSLPAGTATIGSAKITDGTLTATVRDTGSSDSLNVAIVDAAGAQITSFGGGTQYDEDTVSAAADKITMAGVVRVDSGTSICDANNDRTQLIVDSSGKLWVNTSACVVTSVTPGTTATLLGKAVDAVAGTTDTGVAVLAVRDDTLTALTPVDGDYVHLRVNSQGALHVTGGGGGTQYAIDDAAGLTPTGTVALVVRKDTGASLAGTDGDVTGLQVDANGALRVTGGGGGTEYAVNAVVPADPTGATFVMERDDVLAALTEVEGDWTNPRANANGALWTMLDPASSVTASCLGPTAPDSPIAANPITTGGRASDAIPTAMSADGDVVQLWLDRRGAAKSAMVDDAGDSCMDGTNNALRVNIVAGSSSGTQYTEDAVAAADPVGTALNLVRQDTLSTIEVSANGDNIAARGSSTGAQYVELTSGATKVAIGGGVEASALRVTIASDSTGVVTVDGTVSISGTVTVDSELPAAAALADNTANPTVPLVGSCLMAFDGTTWDRVQTGGAATGALKVDGSAVTQPVSAASLPLPTGASTLAEQQTQTTALQLIDDTVATTAAAIPTKGIAVSGTDGTNARVLKTDTTGELQVDVLTLPALVAGTANIGDVDVLSIAAGDNNIGNVDVVTLPALPTGTNTIGNVGNVPLTSGGLTISRTLSAASTNATSVKASAGQLYGWYITNINAAVRYVKLYDKASAPTVGTDTPVMTLAIPAAATGAGTNIEYSMGIPFATGIAMATTTGAADADTGAVAANEIIIHLFYK